MLEGEFVDPRSQIRGSSDIFRRQAITRHALRGRYRMHICPTSGPWLRHRRSLDSPRGRTFNTHERCRLLPRRHRARGHDGQATLRPRRRLLRDVQVL